MRIARLVPGLLLALVARPVAAQEWTRVMVTQIAGQNLYLDAGVAAGIRAGDTLAVRRGAGGPSVGTFAVIAATPGRSLVTFVGTPFPVTRGDTLTVTTHGAVVAATPASVQPVVRAPAIRSPSRRSSGALGFDVFASRSTAIGLGADPTRSTQSYATPSVRGRWTFDNPATGTAVSLNLTALHRAGPAGLFRPENVLRVYEARVDQPLGAGAARLSFGRFLSTFDHASGYWDGAMVRFGAERGLSAGIAGGFEPDRTNETFSAHTPKYAAFVNLRTRGTRARYRADLAFHQAFPGGSALRQTVLDLGQRLDAGGLHLGQDLEVGPDPLGGAWKVNRFQARASGAVGGSGEIYGLVVSDHPPPLDTLFVPLAGRRERLAIGLGHHGSRLSATADLSVNAPRTAASRGYAASLSLGLPGLARGLSLAVAGSYFTFPGSHGLMAGPTVEWAARGTRARTGYQLFLTKGTLYSSATHGIEAMLARTLAPRVEWTARVNLLYGASVRSSSVFTGLDIRF